MTPADFDVLTFDCYGTLIDWEAGIVAAIRPWLEGQGLAAEDDHILEVFAVCESRQQAETPAMVYPELLARVHEAMAGRLGARSSAAEAASMVRSGFR